MIKVLALAIAVSGCKPADDCERAVDRLLRITPGPGRAHMLDSCRTSKTAALDPVLRCAMDSASDAEAAACIERGIRDVVKPGSGDGSGINPLLQ